MKGIIEYMRNLERLIKSKKAHTLFGTNSFPEAERLMEIPIPTNEFTLGSALTVLNRCFVESIEKVGESLGKPKYFWIDIKGRYPDLHDALHRIKVYRHNSHHLQLNPGIESALRGYLERDLDDSLAMSGERHWGLFQRCLDELFRAIQRESARL